MLVGNYHKDKKLRDEFYLLSYKKVIIFIILRAKPEWR